MPVPLELDTTTSYEFVIVNAQKQLYQKRPTLTFRLLLCKDGPEDTFFIERFAIPEDIRKSLLWAIMEKTGYTPDNQKPPDPSTHFRKGMHLFAKVQRQYVEGSDAIRYKLDRETISGQPKSAVQTVDEVTRKRVIARVRSSSTLKEAIERCNTGSHQDVPALIDLIRGGEIKFEQ